MAADDGSVVAGWGDELEVVLKFRGKKHRQWGGGESGGNHGMWEGGTC